MSDIVESRLPDLGNLISIQDRFLEWLCESALPLWDLHGVDRDTGGYFESVEAVGDGVFSVTGSVRRGRVVARQIYAFDVGHRLGWRSRFRSPVEHGCDYLWSRLHDADGMFHTSVHSDPGQPVAVFSLYEHAFYLFVLARLVSTPERQATRRTALRCLEQLRARWGNINGGFEEALPPTLPLKSNPHMHLLEAALAWLEVSEESDCQPWLELAEELVDLCQRAFVDTNSGAVREYFDREWRPSRGIEGRIVEPGHQFEWAWLLLKWSASGLAHGTFKQACVDTALRLMELGERWGVDPIRGVAINEIWDDMRVKDGNAKLWPQTERLKAWCVRLETSRCADDAAYACQKIGDAARGLSQYLCIEPAGLWHESWSAEGSFVPGPSKASSFYHVVCAIDVLRQTVATLSPMHAFAAHDPGAAAVNPA